MRDATSTSLVQQEAARYFPYVFIKSSQLADSTVVQSLHIAASPKLVGQPAKPDYHPACVRIVREMDGQSTLG
jgi:hypothetical protein